MQLQATLSKVGAANSLDMNQVSLPDTCGELHDGCLTALPVRVPVLSKQTMSTLAAVLILVITSILICCDFRNRAAAVLQATITASQQGFVGLALTPRSLDRMPYPDSAVPA